MHVTVLSRKDDHGHSPCALLRDRAQKYTRFASSAHAALKAQETEVNGVGLV
jgi:hypothetical protein